MTISEFETVIGLEVHCQLDTHSKLFCSCPTTFGAEANRNTCPVCLGWPGSLPVLNEQALRFAVKTGLALNCEIAERLKFDRKNYFYPDLPKAYQISQYDMPVNKNGFLMIEFRRPDGSFEEKRIGITRAHLEEDAGKLLHDGIKDGTLADYNRAGIPLLEIVSEPDLRSPEEAYAYLSALKAVLEYLEVSDCNMEEGSLRCDANVSIRPRGQEKFGTRTEIKNLNSFKAVQKAIEYEVKRQAQVVLAGERIVQETRLWNDDKGQTFVMRSKEEAHDYRYFPEPDLPPFETATFDLENLKMSIPELPAAKRARFVKEYGLAEKQAGLLVAEPELAEFFEEAVSELREKKADAPVSSLFNYLTSDFRGLLNESGIRFKESKIDPEHLAHLAFLINEGKIGSRQAKDILKKMFDTGLDPEEIVQQEGGAVSDEGELGATVDGVIAENTAAVADYKKGKKESLQFLIGKAMAKLKGRGDPEVLRMLFQKALTR